MLNASRVQRIEIFMEFSEFIIIVRDVAGNKPKVKKLNYCFLLFFLMTLEMILTSVNSSSICTLKDLF